MAVPATAQTPLPGLDNFTLERPQPAPPTPTPTVTPTPVPTTSPTATPTPATPTPTPTATRTPTATPTATRAPTQAPVAMATPTATPSASPTSAVPPVATPTAEPVPTATEPATPPAADAPASSSSDQRWLWLVGAAVLAVVGALVLWRRRESDIDDVEPAIEPQVEPAPPPTPVPAAAAPVAAPPVAPAKPAGARPGGLITSALKPDLRLNLRPRRAGVDTLRATLEYDVQLVNAGRAVARALSVEAWLLSASHETAADLARIFASPAGESMLAPFDLPNNSAFDLSGTAVAPRKTLATITAGDRRLFVPMLAFRLTYRDTRDAVQTTTAAFLVGTEREGQERLAPLPLDRGSAMRERLAARPYLG